VYGCRLSHLIRGFSAGLFFLLSGALHFHAQTPLDRLVQEALRNNPGIGAQRALIEAARQRVPQARALPDPSADLELMNLSVSNPSLKDALTESVSVGVTQALPFSGKRRLAAEAATKAVEVEESRLASMERMLGAQVLGAAYRYTLSLRLLDINDLTQNALGATTEATLGAYGAGMGNQSDILLAQAASTRAQAEREDLAKGRQIALARLSSLLTRPVEEKELSSLQFPEPTPLPPLPHLLAVLDASAPEVQTAKSESAVADAEVAMARRAFKPDFTVGARYRFRDMSMGGGDYITAMVGISLPFFHYKDRYRPALAEALANSQGSLEGIGAALAETRYKLIEAYQSAARDAAVYGLYEKGLLLQSRQAYEATLASYSAGRADFGSLLMALTNLYTVQADAAMAQAEYFQMSAEIDAILGVPLSAITSPSNPIPDSTKGANP
jgi:outer membrane protein, heavy metal efflux system